MAVLNRWSFLINSCLFGNIISFKCDVWLWNMFNLWNLYGGLSYTLRESITWVKKYLPKLCVKCNCYGLLPFIWKLSVLYTPYSIHAIVSYLKHEKAMNKIMIIKRGKEECHKSKLHLYLAYIYKNKLYSMYSKISEA